MLVYGMPHGRDVDVYDFDEPVEIALIDNSNCLDEVVVGYGVLLYNSSSATNAGNSVAGTNFNPLASINPSDIESIEVLKDVSASAIYGSDNERFHISGNYTSQDGVIRGTGFTRLGARLNYEREFAETPMDCRYLDLVV